MTDQEWCSACSEPLTGEGFLLTPPWPEIQQCCSLACVQQIVNQWTEYVAENGLPTPEKAEPEVTP